MLEQRDELAIQVTLPRPRLLWIGASLFALLLFIVVFLIAQTRAKRMFQSPQGSPEVLAVITNSGSTNTPGSTLTINTDGSGSITYQKRAGEQRFARYVDKTYAAGTFESSELANVLTQIKDVGTIPNRNCLKSASFGSTTTVTYQGKTSGDVSCLSDEDAKMFLDLKDVVHRITAHV